MNCQAIGIQSSNRFCVCRSLADVVGLLNVCLAILNYSVEFNSRFIVFSHCRRVCVPAQKYIPNLLPFCACQSPDNCMLDIISASKLANNFTVFLVNFFFESTFRCLWRRLTVALFQKRRISVTKEGEKGKNAEVLIKLQILVLT